MSELKTLAHDATKSTDDVLLYEAEYVELQEQFKKTVTEEFNEIRLFSPDSKVEHLFFATPRTRRCDSNQQAKSRRFACRTESKRWKNEERGDNNEQKL
jgi:hypothetical protein